MKTRAGGGPFSDAALDAAAGRLWIHEPVVGDPGSERYATQLRWIERLSRVLGLSPRLSERTAEQIGECLQIPRTEHRESRTHYRAAQRSQQRGRVLVAVLGEIPLEPRLCSRLLTAGFLGGAWARAWTWRPTEADKVSLCDPLRRPERGPPPLEPSNFVLPPARKPP